MRATTMLAVLAGLILVPSVAAGGVLNGHADAWVDPVGGFAWTGSTPFANGDLQAVVDWAVFGPGDYPGTGYTYLNDLGVLTTGGPDANQFVYAYQVYSLGTLPVTQLIVNMIESNEADKIGYDATVNGGGTPAASYFAGPPPALQSANWLFVPALEQNDNSIVLVYSSVNMPLWDNLARVKNGGTFAEGPVPTPSDLIPEPATMALLGIGLGGLVLRSRKRAK